MDIKETYDNEAKIYCMTSRQVTPFYDLSLNKLVESLPTGCNQILDLFCGTGVLTKMIFDKYPNAEVLGVDLSEGMLDIAKRALEDKDFSCLCCDVLDLEQFKENKNKFDLAVSSFGIHNVKTKEAKLKTLKNIAMMLKCGCKYFCCDYLKGKDEDEIKRFSEIELEHLKKSFNTKEIKYWTDLLKDEDDPESWEDYSILLKKAGFGKIKLIWQKDFLAVWCAEKL